MRINKDTPRIRTRLIIPQCSAYISDSPDDEAEDEDDDNDDARRNDYDESGQQEKSRIKLLGFKLHGYVMFGVV